MDVSRRDVMVAGGVLLGVSSLVFSSTAGAQAADEAAVTESVEVLRKAILEQNKAKLDQVTAPQLSYGHSSARFETKDQFITGVMTRKQTVKTLTFPELKVTVVGNAAIARHLYLSDSELDGKMTITKIGVLEVWQKQDGAWKLLARQAFTLPSPA